MPCSPPPTAATPATPSSASRTAVAPPSHRPRAPNSPPLAAFLPLRRRSALPATDYDKTLATITRRSLLTLPPFLIHFTATAGAGAGSPLDLVQYTDRNAGFTLLKPSSWKQVEKAGATALFQEEGKGANNIGVVVNPVRLSSLTEFGTPEFVAEKLIQAERKKV